MSEGSRHSSETQSSGPLGGERLAAARRAHEISATDIAKELHLDELKIRALEKNDFAVLGAPVFAKGHLRKYAELVGVPVDDVLADYYELNRSAGAPPVVGPVRKKAPRDIAWGTWIGAILALLIVLGGLYWFFAQGPSLSLTHTTPEVSTSEPTPQRPVERQLTVAADAPATVPDADEEIPANALASLSPPGESLQDAAETTQLPQVNVELVYSGDCWTEVTDASGRSLWYDLGTEGRVVTLSGDEPLQVVLGASDNVSIAVNGRDFPIPDAARRGRMARLTISSQ
ncbi:MAG: DUF4115 domain-containing protein [Woeseiaceae bacterium]|nr:DUF4115 domain-containing protein [Woeseiaceae bacterium]